MPWNRTRRVMAVWLLVSLLGVPWCLAADGRPSAKNKVHGWGEFWAQVKGECVGLLKEYGAVLGALKKDRNLGAPQSSQEATEIGCAVDPYGRCL